MTDLCLNIMTKICVPVASDSLDQIWLIDNWIESLDRVLDVKVWVDDGRHQRFSMTFDAGRNTPDQIEVERIRTESAIRVTHIVPPPGIRALSAVWWQMAGVDEQLFARRTILMDQCDYTEKKARHMFGLLRENLIKLLGQDRCGLAN